MTRYYSRAGDKGETSIIGERITKNHPRIEAIGTIDELNSVIGLAMCFQKEKRIRKMLEDIQDNLFNVGAELASKSEKITEKHVKNLEENIDSFDLDQTKKFILPNGGISSTSLHFARTVARRAERVIVSLSRKEKVSQELLKYLNRLSSLLFVLSIYTNRKEGRKEKSPSYS